MASTLDSATVWETLRSSIHFISEHAPMILLQLHIILAAIFPIYTGSHAALTRPATAEKAAGKPDGTDDDEEQEEDSQIMEALTASDAIVFPVTAGIVLATLYWLIKTYGAQVINRIMAWYFAGVGIFSIAKLVNDTTELCLSFLAPRYIAEHGIVQKLVYKDGHIIKTTGHDERLTEQSKANVFWSAKAFLRTLYQAEFYIKHIEDTKGSFTTLNVISIVSGFAAVLFSNLVANPWWLTNVQGFAVSYFALQFMSPTSFVIGSLVLGGLFFYDIWAVFFTPLMVTVATKLEQPIKLLFPKPGVDDGKAYSMLGLGDIVVPGLMIGLALRFDLHMYYKRKQTADDHKDDAKKAIYTPATGHWGSRFWTRNIRKDALPVVLQNAAFPRPYFTASLVGYVSGMLITLVVMNFFQHAQPALLYLVPAVLSSLWGTAAWKGELRDMWAYSEELTGEAVSEETATEKKETEKRSWWELITEELFVSKQPANKEIQEKKDKTKSSDGSDKRSPARSHDIVVDISVKLKPNSSRVNGSSIEHEKTS